MHRVYRYCPRCKEVPPFPHLDYNLFLYCPHCQLDFEAYDREVGYDVLSTVVSVVILAILTALLFGWVFL